MRIFLSTGQNKELEQTLRKRWISTISIYCSKEDAKEAIIEVLDYLNNINCLYLWPF